MKRKPIFLYFLIISVLATTGFLFFYEFFVARAGTLSCSVATSCAGGTVIFKMSDITNAHAELANQSNYNQLVCCSGVTNLATACSGSYVVAAKLSGATNAHVEQNTQSNYLNNACISVPSGATVSVGYRANDCSGYDATIFSMTGVTNAHVGNAAAYNTKICATASDPVVSVTVADGIVTYGFIAAGGATRTTSIGLDDSQIATNDGTGTQTFNIKTQDSLTVGGAWQNGATGSVNFYKHEFCIDTAANDCDSAPIWTSMATSSYTTLTTSSVAAGGNILFDLQATIPTTTSTYGAQYINVTVQAVGI